MDELLASIREIIEENAGVSLADNGRADSGRQASESSNRTAKAEVHMQPRNAGSDAGMPHQRQDIRVAARNNAAPPVQDAMNALAERIGLRKAVAPAQPETAMRPASHQGAAPSAGQPQRMSVVRESKPEAPRVVVKAPVSKQKRPPDARQQEGNEFEKGFRNDVERSAELLLRPYISQWLDEHFRQLFERILREEIQRFIQALRR